MFALVVLKSQHGKKNILVILTHLVGNIKALICHVRDKDEQGKALFANVERGVGIFLQNCHNFLPIVGYKSDGLYCRMAGTPSSPTMFFIRV